MIDYDLANYIAADEAIIASAGARIWPNKQPDNLNTLYPCVLIFRVSTTRVYAHDGASGLAQSRFEVVSMAGTYKAARDLSDLIRRRLEGFSGTMGDSAVDSIRLVDDGDFLNMRNNAKTAFYAVTQDYAVHYREVAIDLATGEALAFIQEAPVRLAKGDGSSLVYDYGSTETELGAALEAAVAAAESGDQIILGPGRYETTATIDTSAKALSIFGAGMSWAGGTIVAAPTNGWRVGANSTLSGLAIIGGSGTSAAALIVSGLGVRAIGCRFHGEDVAVSVTAGELYLYACEVLAEGEDGILNAGGTVHVIGCKVENESELSTKAAIRATGGYTYVAGGVIARSSSDSFSILRTAGTVVLRGAMYDHEGLDGTGLSGTIDTGAIAVTGSRDGNAALASLLTALATRGIITDSTTA